MIIVRTPFRISFAGGGSDLPVFFKQSEGAVLSTTIDKYLYTAIHAHFERDTILLKYSRTEKVKNPRKLKNNIANQVLTEYGITGVEIETIGDIPSGTGLGSSSAFAVGLHQAVATYRGEKTTPGILAEKACVTEIEHLRCPIGKQDQYAAAFGGFNFIRFRKNGEVTVEKIKIKPKTLKKLKESLMLFYLGTTRSANSILQKQRSNIQKSEKVVGSLKFMVKLAHQMKKALESDNLHLFAKLLHDNWMLKKSLSDSISNKVINGYYEEVIKKGYARGGKVLGAGGGGFLLIMCDNKHREAIRECLKDLREVPFDFSSKGSNVVFHS